MRSPRLAPIITLALAALLASEAAASTAPTASARAQTLSFDARSTHTRTAAPNDDHVGHGQIASGILRHDARCAVGRFAFTCTSTRILTARDALEHCTGCGRTAHRQPSVAGPARSSDLADTSNVMAGVACTNAPTGLAFMHEQDRAVLAGDSPRSSSHMTHRSSPNTYRNNH